ncbi:hypothetical protein HPB49_011447 [Dermacentor silvarum]|uniref:Uncharacterized protein n=1 Tax=Dermacentor silvarum TaxID=543639 RepID=A0ACB8DCY1_DERSI|nr:hypothetical protein HPB49_011447 [Dermacentor silvarum]
MIQNSPRQSASELSDSRRVVPLFDDSDAVPPSEPPTQPKQRKAAATPVVSSAKQRDLQEKDKEKEEARLRKLREKFRVDEGNKYDKLAHSVTPLWRHPYRKQLMFKYQDVSKHLQRLGQQLRKVDVAFPEDPNGLPCPLRPVLPSPVVEGYRNKDEFSIRQGPSGEPKTVGFLVGSPGDLDHVVCVSPEHIVVCKDSHKRVAKSFQEYIQRSPLPGCYETNFQGYWKHLVVRSNSAGQLMAIVVMHPQQLTPAPFELLHGQPHLEETLGDLRFRISPESFFQVNSPVATYLYDAVRQLLHPKPQGTLLDICCGTDRHCSRAAMSSRGKYRAKTLKEKVEILREVDAGKQSKNEIAKKHDIPRSTLSTYIRNKKTIEDSYAAETFAKDRERIRTAKHPDLEAALLAWIKEKRSQDIPLSGPIIVAKVADFALRTIGLSLARQLHSVFGMDVSAQAVEDAVYNAQLNGISNVQYQVGRAELLLPEIRHQFVAEDLCAVVNPGRGGLNTRAIRALREYKQIKRLVYISCKPEGAAMDNFVELCDNRPKTHKLGPPFRLQLACPVDMFPQTRHCELLVLFGRS